MPSEAPFRGQLRQKSKRKLELLYSTDRAERTKYRPIERHLEHV